MSNPDPYTPVALVNATFYFSFDSDLIGQNADGSSTLFGTVNGTADRNGLSVGTNINVNSEAFSGGGTVCFANSSGGFVLTPGSVTSTCQSRFSASGYGSTNGLFEYSGFVTGLTVSNGGGGIVPRIANGVPEPSTWVLMLAGFGMVGYAIRRRKQAFA